MNYTPALNYSAITQSVLDTVGCFSLLFIRPEPEGYLHSIISFKFNEIIFLRDDCFIMQGITEMLRHPKPVYVQIQYVFSEEKFYEVVYCANGTIRKKAPLTLLTAGDVGENNLNTANMLNHHMTNCSYSKA